MRKFMFLPIIATLFFGVVVFAQDSPFGNLADERRADRIILTTEGLVLEDYLSTRANFDNLSALYERAYGTRKVELAGQLVARAMDVLFAKLGSTRTFLADLHDDTAKTGRLSEDRMLMLAEAIKSYDEVLASYRGKVEEKGTLDELTALADEIDDFIEEYMDVARLYVSVLATARGEYIIDQLEKVAPIMQAHMNASADLGGDIVSIQESFDLAMLSMEDAKDGYKVINVLVGSGMDLAVESIAELNTIAFSANNSLDEAYTGLGSVLAELRILYSHSPWEIDTTQFENIFWEEL